MPFKKLPERGNTLRSSGKPIHYSVRRSLVCNMYTTFSRVYAKVISYLSQRHLVSSIKRVIRQVRILAIASFFGPCKKFKPRRRIRLMVVCPLIRGVKVSTLVIEIIVWMRPMSTFDPVRRYYVRIGVAHDCGSQCLSAVICLL